MSISKFQFEMISDPACLSFYNEDWEEDGKIGVPIRNYAKILFKDSLFNFFPYSELYYKDSSGQIVDSVFFVEGLELKCKLGYIKQDEEKTETEQKDTKRKDYLEHDYIWSANEVNNINFSNGISGDNLFMMISKYFYNDVPQSRSFNHEDSPTKQTISDILVNTILPKWGIDKTKYALKETISETSGTLYIPQNNMTNKEYISKLAEYAYSSNNQSSGFYTFINCNGEFYFATIQMLMNQQPIKKYTIDLNTDMMVSEDYIKDYRVFHGGVPVNFDNYNRRLYNYKFDSTLEKSVSVNENILKYADEYEFDTDTKLLIRNQYIPTANTKHSYMGIQQSIQDIEFHKGFKNYYYRDTAMCYRMAVVVSFDANIVSGKTIEIYIEHLNKENEQAAEFSGNWLICESTHIIDKNGIPYSQLILSKPQIKIDSTHPFFNDFKTV